MSGRAAVGDKSAFRMNLFIRPNYSRGCGPNDTRYSTGLGLTSGTAQDKAPGERIALPDSVLSNFLRPTSSLAGNQWT